MSAVFRAVDEPAASRIEYWQHVVGEAAGPLELPFRSALEVRDRLRVCELGAVRLVDLSISSAGGARRARRHIRSSDADLRKIDVQVRGRGVVEQDGRQAC